MENLSFSSLVNGSTFRFGSRPLFGNKNQDATYYKLQDTLFVTCQPIPGTDGAVSSAGQVVAITDSDIPVHCLSSSVDMVVSFDSLPENTFFMKYSDERRKTYTKLNANHCVPIEIGNNRSAVAAGSVEQVSHSGMPVIIMVD